VGKKKPKQQSLLKKSDPHQKKGFYRGVRKGVLNRKNKKTEDHKMKRGRVGEED